MLANRVRMSYIKKGSIPDYYVMATDSDFSGTADGEFRYSGTHEYVIIPHIIKGVNVTSYYGMFQGGTYLNLKGIASDNPNVTGMSSMFFNFNTGDTTLDLSSFDTSNVTDMMGMFGFCKLTSLDLSNFDTSSVTSMNQMFNGCSSLTSLDLSSFDTSSVTHMNQMIDGCSSLTSLDLSSFDTSSVTHMTSMFKGCTFVTTAYARTQGDADKFNASSNKPSNVNFVVKIKWQTAQDIVRAGEASNYFDVGDEFVSNYDGQYIIWQVIGIDVDTPTDSNYTHSMTIQTKDCVENGVWDSGGNSRYINSDIRAYLNSSFLSKLDPELSAVIGLVNKKVAVSNPTGGQDSFSDKVFLLSKKEVDLGDEGVTTGEFVYPFYNGKGDANRIKNLDGSARAWWLRSPLVFAANVGRGVRADGSESYGTTNTTGGVSPACVII